jgi:PAS domain S-box-containing protein
MGKNSSEADKFGKLRARAEEKLSKKIVKLREKHDGNLEGVLHELHVHQIELEMQNEELRQTQRQLEESRSRYADLYDFAPAGYFTFDSHGVVVEANLAGCRMLGVERSTLIGKPFTLYVDKACQDTFYLHRQAALTAGLRQTCEIAIVRKDGDRFDAQLESIAAADANGEFTRCRTTIIDVTER